MFPELPEWVPGQASEFANRLSLYNARVTAVYVIRHPETTWNREKRYQGRLEAPWSAEGRRQAELLWRSFVGHRLDAVLSSPLTRALDLADSLAGVTGAALRVDHRLTEIGQCAWEGLYVEEIRECYSEMYERWYTRPDTVRFPHGEDLQDVRRRSLSALADVLQGYPGGEVALVSHSIVTTSLVAAALCLDPSHIHRVRVSNASVSILCGDRLPMTLMELNGTDALYGSAAKRVAALACARWEGTRTTQ